MNLLRNLLLFTIIWNIGHCYELKDAVSDTLRTNNNVLALKAKIRSAEIINKAAVSEFMPNINLTIGMDPTLSASSSTISNKFPRNQQPNISSPHYTWQLQQNIFNYGKSTAKLKKSNYDYKIKEYSSQAEINNIILSTIATYLEILKANKTVQLYEESVLAMTNHLDSEKKKFQFGESNKSDLAQAEARLSSTKAQHIKAISHRNNISAKFFNLTGKHSEGIKYPVFNEKKIPRDFNEILKIARRNNLNLKVAYNSKKSAELARAIEIGNMTPSLDLNTQFIYGAAEINGVTENYKQLSKSISLNFSIPIFQGGREYVAIAASNKNVIQADEMYKSTYKTLQEEITIAWNDYKNFDLIIPATKDVLKSNEISLDIVKDEAKLDIKTSLDVIDAEIELLKARIQLMNDKNSQLNSMYKILSIINTDLAKHI